MSYQRTASQLGGTVTGAWACSCPTETPRARRLPAPMAGLPAFSTFTYALLAAAGWVAYRQYRKDTEGERRRQRFIKTGTAGPRRGAGGDSMATFEKSYQSMWSS